jgi:hypothetical protein
LKKEVVKVLREWKRIKTNRNSLLEAKKDTRRNVERRRSREGRKRGKEIKKIRTEKEVWKYINREKKRGNNNTRMERGIGWKKRERKMMARFRCGNERKTRYWMKDEERRCRMCYEERKPTEHKWNGCCEMREREEWKGEKS